MFNKKVNLNLIVVKRINPVVDLVLDIDRYFLNIKELECIKNYMNTKGLYALNKLLYFKGKLSKHIIKVNLYMQYLKHLLILLVAFISPVSAVEAVTHTGEAQLTQIVYEAKTQSESSDGGSGSSRTRSVILERIIEKNGDGLELEYFYPEFETPANDNWKLPARVLIEPGTSITLLNESEIAVRLNEYLNKYPDIREKCGKTIFTWTAFEIHCNTSHVIDLIKFYNLRFGVLYGGKDYVESGAIESVPLKQKKSKTSNLIYEALLILDPKYLQMEYEKNIKKAAEMVGESFDAMMQSSLRLIGNETPSFSGTRLVTIEVAPDGTVMKLHRETMIKIKGGEGFEETRIQNESFKRQRAE